MGQSIKNGGTNGMYYVNTFSVNQCMLEIHNLLCALPVQSSISNVVIHGCRTNMPKSLFIAL